ncbi:MAG TPA: FtsK/SpoIIIE domain-containing protein [Actinopolymorphaceae bacterium]
MLAIAHVISDRRSGRKEYREKLKEYEKELAAARTRLRELAVEQERTTRRDVPDPATLVRIATGPTARLYERRPGDDDFGQLRVGLVDRPVDVRLAGQGADAEELPTAHAVPMSVQLASDGVVGVAGPRSAVLPIARAMVAHAAVLHAPHDLGLVVFSGSPDDWEWASWLPHTVPHRADVACRRMLASDRKQAEERIAELRRLIDERLADSRSALRDQPPAGRRMLVVLDGAYRLRNLPGLADVLADGPAAGVYALCLDSTQTNLPDECRATVVVTSHSGTRVRVSRPGADAVDDVLADGIPEGVARRIAYALAPVRVLGARFGGDADLPDRVRFLELAGLGPEPSADDVLRRWAAQPGGRSTQILLGADATGPVTVDLRRDGPHGLVAGTSGAGKSELLQTLVAALALGNTPDALEFVLVDYKGGSAFADCADLPHCVGLVTDLDGHLASRALTSLTAELKRRETILAEAGAKDIEDYWATTGDRLPRLVIVIDEFATLAEEVPEFVSGVVGIGMRGRSLGVHVILATQRPGGVVNAEIRANVNLRLCLRVTRAEESSDVVDVPDAARISRLHPGRAYLRAGHQDLAILQCARVGWPRGGDTDARSAAREVRVHRRRFETLGAPRPQRTSGPELGGDGDTDLKALVAAIRTAAERSGIKPPASPWLPPLPEQVTLSQLMSSSQADATTHRSSHREPTQPSVPSPVAVPIALGDHPTEQTQRPYVLDLDQAAPVVIAGMTRSGRSTVLRTIACSLASNSSPADVHLYALDYGGRALASLATLPHCGAWIDADETDRVERLLDLFGAEIGRRAKVLAEGGYASIAEQRAATEEPHRLPYLVLLLDRYESFLARHNETDGGRLVEALDGILRRGSAVGILSVLATDRSGFTHRMSGLAATRMVLRQADPDDVAVYGADARQMPRAMPPGRAVVVPGDVEIQVAMLAADPQGAAQAAAVEELAASLARRWDGVDARRLARRVDPLPTSITLAEVEALRTGDGRGLAESSTGPRRTSQHTSADTSRAESVPPTVCTVGAGGDHLGPVDVDLAELGSTFLVSGPARSGRSTALATIVESLAGRATGDLQVVLCCPRSSPLTELAELPGVLRLLTGPEIGTDLDDTLGLAGGPVAIVVDDAEYLGDSVAADVLDQLVRGARDDGNVVVAAGTTEELMLQRYRGWIAGIRRARCGLLLNPMSYTDGEVFDLRLPRSTRGGWPAGRALLVRRDSTQLVQVPLRGGAAALDPADELAWVR